MSWLGRLTPRGAPAAARPGRGAAPHEVPSCTADPETCLMVFENHWRQLWRVLEQSQSSRSTDDLIAVRNHTDQMFCLLAEERPPPSEGDLGGEDRDGEGRGGSGPILQLVIREQVLERLLLWHLDRGPDTDSLGALLKLFEMLVGQSRQALLRRPAVLRPLLRLVGACAPPDGGCPPALENGLVLLLNQVCAWVAREPALLETLLRAAPAPRGSGDLPVLSLLVPFIHREGAVGQQARDALLLVMAASASDRAVARYIAHNSYFCPVLATGLSALYSSLPRKMEARGDDWHALRREDWTAVSSLVVFMNSLEFCNAVVQVAHPAVRSQLLDYLHNGFLVPVVAPALYKSSVDEMIASTAYLDLFLRSVSETPLLKTFLRFILLHRLDNDSILDTLLARIASNSRLCMVSLSLFRTLVSLNCEDIMLQLVLRYLLPCSHVMLSQRRAIRETDMYGKCADKFLSLIPECCRTAVQEEDPPKMAHDAGGDSGGGGGGTPTRPSTPSRLTFFIRQQSSASGGPPGPADYERSAPDSPARGPRPTVAALDRGYLDYLKDARRGVELCSWACRDWSAPYDGENPCAGASPPPLLAAAAYPERRSARSEWSGSEHDSGEWEVTIGQNNCISLTPRSKKRGFQRRQPLAKPVPPHLGPAAPFAAPFAASPPAPDNSREALLNGAAEPSEPRPDGDRELEAKKVKRDSEQRDDPQQNDASGQPSVESLIRELLENSPDDGEAFGGELQEPERRVDPEGKRPAPDDTGESSHGVLCSPARPLAQGSCQPYTGPLMAALLAKMENMPHNSLYVNILLTGVVARLACYPQPLLRSFLLNTNMVFQPSVKSLVQVLGSVKSRIEAFAASREDFPAMLRKAQQYLVARGKLDRSEPPGAVPPLRRSDSLVKSRKSSLSDLILRHTNSPARSRSAAQMALAHVRVGGQTLHSALFGSGVSNLEKQAEALRVKNAVYCAVIFCEFLKELAALAQEHAVALPFAATEE
ncbi:FHF complex subunit HOOK-interacting protein 1B isoform 1-T3 [Syngnathus typhle]